eukprot:CAMPEP_0119114660 /NCGR_PEP_ID=MMETSP1180-20130426/48190_1 /TAXON_ID=3052 ORGANISM="Chlamydomonas cf sp, Strain CCMP681" /NCGR_SAMPLE_ID=MMETSP1180 /ASSEMBLY_ACC=CAM_ASM_000741 /LENGTH=57 /DNA_ID=CAMNT_0007103303 /DNA_START=98 /DNA_END=271 /DNA_ORIENTATION=+
MSLSSIEMHCVEAMQPHPASVMQDSSHCKSESDSSSVQTLMPCPVRWLGWTAIMASY